MSKIFVEIIDLTKKFSGIKVLDKVNVHFKHNEIVGLIGENGAGKSTLMNALCGIFTDWDGKILLNSQSIRPQNYYQANLLGIARVFQEQSLVPSIKVYENMLLSHENYFKKFGFLNKKKMVAIAKEELREFNINIDVTRLTGDCDFSTRQTIEIAKASRVCQMLGSKMPLILLDEPTAALTEHEIEVFFEQMKFLKKKASIVFISHRLSEVTRICDRIYILKDGKVVDEVFSQDINESDLHEKMVGRKRDADYYKEDQQRITNSKPILKFENVSCKSSFKNVSLEVCPGEILGVGGVLGSGKEMLGRVLAGIQKWNSGKACLFDNPLTAKGYIKKIKKLVGYIPKERHLEGIILYISVAWNLTLASIDSFRKKTFGFINLRKEKQTVKSYIDKLSIKTPKSDTLAVHLSGGNQQKVVLARWLLREPKILILDNPTRGMDAGAKKEEIYSLLRKLAKRDMAIILISDELLELIGLSNRIILMKDGQVTQCVESPVENKPSESELVKYMV